MGQIPSGTSLLTVLQDAERALQKVVHDASGHLPTESQARGIAERLREWVRAGISDLFDYSGLSVDAPSVELVAGSFADFIVDVKNDGTLPLRSVRVESEPDWGLAHTSFLAEGDALALSLRGDVPKL